MEIRCNHNLCLSRLLIVSCCLKMSMSLTEAHTVRNKRLFLPPYSPYTPPMHPLCMFITAPVMSSCQKFWELELVLCFHECSWIFANLLECSWIFVNLFERSFVYFKVLWEAELLRHLTLNFDIETWHWISALKSDIELQQWNLTLDLTLKFQLHNTLVTNTLQPMQLNQITYIVSFV